MNKLLDTMFIKRFCLPYNSDINSYEDGNSSKITTCLCGNYNHISCILKGKGRFEKG